MSHADVVVSTLDPFRPPRVLEVRWPTPRSNNDHVEPQIIIRPGRFVDERGVKMLKTSGEPVALAWRNCGKGSFHVRSCFDLDGDQNGASKPAASCNEIDFAMRASISVRQDMITSQAEI